MQMEMKIKPGEYIYIKIDSKTKNVTKDKEKHYKMQQDITIVIYTQPT